MAKAFVWRGLPDSKKKPFIQKRHQEILAVFATAGEKNNGDLILELQELIKEKDILMRREFKEEQLKYQDEMAINLLNSVMAMDASLVRGITNSESEAAQLLAALRKVHEFSNKYCCKRQIGKYQPKVQEKVEPAPPPPPPIPPSTLKKKTSRVSQSFKSPQMLKVAQANSFSISNNDLKNSAKHLKASNINRSPGGTPCRDKNKRVNNGDLRDHLDTALSTKFKSVNSPETQDSPSSFDGANSPCNPITPLTTSRIMQKKTSNLAIVSDGIENRQPSHANINISDEVMHYNPKLSINSDVVGVDNPRLSINSDVVGVDNPRLSINSDVIGVDNPKLSINSDAIGVEIHS